MKVFKNDSFNQNLFLHFCLILRIEKEPFAATVQDRHLWYQFKISDLKISFQFIQFCLDTLKIEHIPFKSKVNILIF